MNITLALDYTITDENVEKEYREIYKKLSKQTSSASFCAYNFMARRKRMNEGYSEKEVQRYLKTLNNIKDIDTAFLHGAYVEMDELIKARTKIEFEFTDEQMKCNSELELKHIRAKQEARRYSVVFGGKKNFLAYQQGKISKDEFDELKRRDLYIVGQKNVGGNRKFVLNEDGSSVLFKINSKTHFNLELKSIGENRKPVIDLLISLQQKKDVALTYRLSPNKLYISFDVEDVYKNFIQYIPNPCIVAAVDQNPNYTGYSIVLWLSETNFAVIDSGVYSYKEITDRWIKSKDKDEKSHLSNKLDSELYNVAQAIVKKARYYKCSVFAVEQLDMKSGNKKRGKYYNTLCNNLFHRNLFTDNVNKYCDMYGIKFIRVVAAYSSFVGNLLYRNLVDAPDMVLASVEIGRRGVEFYHQHILKTKPTKKNIIFPDISLVKNQLAQSLEELSVGLISDVWKDIYKQIAGLVYRVPVDDFFKSRQVSDFRSRKSKVKHFHLTCSSCP